MNKDYPKKIVQTETWKLTDDEFPMHLAYFAFTDNKTTVEIFDKEDKVLFSAVYPAFEFEGAPKWLIKILKMCNVIYKS